MMQPRSMLQEMGRDYFIRLCNRLDIGVKEYLAGSNPPVTYIKKLHKGYLYVVKATNTKLTLPALSIHIAAKRTL